MPDDRQDWRYRIIAETAADAIFTMDEGSTILSANPAVERIFGYSVDELVGKKLTMLVPPELRASHEVGVARFVRTQVPNIPWTGIQLPGLHKDGREIPLEISFGAFREDDHWVFSGIVRDISERVRQQRELEESSAELEATIEELQLRTQEAEAARRAAELEAEQRREAEHRVRVQFALSRLLANADDVEPTKQEMLRVIGEALGWELGAYWEPDGRQEVLLCTAFWQRGGEDRTDFERESRSGPLASGAGLPGRAWQERRPLWIEDVRRDPGFLRGDAAERAGLQSAILFPVATGDRVHGVVEFFTREVRFADGALLLMLEGLGNQIAQFQDRKAAEHAKSDFLAVMSHELRTPLNAVLGYADLLLMGVPTSLLADQVQSVERIRTAARHLLELIDEVLSYARLEAGWEQVNVDVTDIPALVDDVAALIVPLAQARSLRFGVDVGHLPDTVRADAPKVRHILVNLLSNAVKFTEEGGVTLVVRATDGELVFEIRDTGIGIPRDALERIFDPFWQVEQSRRRRVGGSGLGLSVARRLARLLGGDVTVRSTQGAGSIFVLSLPARGTVSA
ncbi:MAG: ATP-binding protein [Gemmatimonadota bacterium]|nr:ATP-binding protein [Gemmatimonadota bacterium]